MCDQSEIAYLPKEIVWVKLGPVWWPGEVQDYDALPEEITKNLRKQPIAVVKFFQEDSYEYIKNLNHIYRYNCLKKNDFIKKGLDLCRSANSRDVPSNMKMFPADIVTAEKRTKGDPNILQSELFVPQEKKNYTELFTTPKKSPKEGTGSGRRGRPASETKANVKSFLVPDVSAATPSPRSITHPRFVGRSNTPDYETHVRQQPPPDSEGTPSNSYKCHICDFSTVRLNVIVLHNKSHTGTNVDFSPKDKGIVSKKFTPRIKALSTPKVKQAEAPKRKLVTESPSPSAVKRANTSPTVKKEVEKQSPSSAAMPTPDPELKSVAKKRGPKPTKTEKLAKIMKENEAIRDDLLKDWDEEDEMAEEEEKSKSFEDKSLCEEADICEDTPSESKDKAGDKETEAKETEDKKAETETKEMEDKNLKEKSCFDFDESDDGINTHEKPISFSRKNSTEPDAVASQKKIDAEVEEVGRKVDDLLSETAVPELPDLKLPGPDSKKLLTFDENPNSNELESKSGDLSQAERNIPTAGTTVIPEMAEKITDGEQSSKIVRDSQPETTEDPKNEEKLEDNEFEVKSPQSTNSLVIDFDAKPIRQRRRSSQPKPKSPVTAEGRPKRTASVTVTSSESVEIPETKTRKTSNSSVSSTPKTLPELIDLPETKSRRSTNASTSFPTKTMKTETIGGQKNAVIEEIVPDLTVPLKTVRTDHVSSSSDRVTAELVPMIKKEFWSSNEPSLDSSAEVKSGAKVGGRRGRPPGKMVVAKPLTPQPIVTNSRRRSTYRKAGTVVATSLVGQEIEVNSSHVVNIGQERITKNISRSTSVLAEVTLTDSQFTQVKALSEPMVTDTIVVAGEYGLNADHSEKTHSNQNSEMTNSNLDFDINSMPIIIDNNEYAPSSLGYEKVESVETISSSTPIEIASVPSGNIPPVKMEPSVEKSPSSFLEKALISNEKALAAVKLKSNAAAVPKKVTAVKAEKGAPPKLIMPVQTPGGPTKMRTVKLASGSKFLPNSKSANQFLLLKTSTGQQLLKSSQLLQQPDGRMIIVTQNQSPRSALTVKGMKTEQFSPGKITTSRIIATKGIVSSSASDTEAPSSSKQIPNILSKIGENSKSKSAMAQAETGPKTLSKVSVSNSVNLAQANTPGSKIILPGKQGGISKVFLSKASSPAGAKFVMHTSPTKVSLPPSLKQKLSLPSTNPASILVPSSAQASKPSTVPMQAASKVVVSQVGPLTSFPTVSKTVKVQKQGPNILQKPQRKLVKPVLTAVTNKVAATSGTSVPSMSNSLVATSAEAPLPPTSVGVVANSSSGTPNVVYVAMDNNTYQAVDSSMLSFDGSQQPTLYINSNTTNLENILLTIDEKGNVNLAQQQPQLFPSEVAAPTQDILAKALADTQVLQTEASIADATNRVAYIESLPYPAPPLISNVHETSLTLNQPIMTPLEVPSSATPNFNLISEQSTNVVKRTSQDMFITQIPNVPSSNVAYQITVDENLVAASSAGLNQPCSDSLVTNIDEDLIKINKPLKPSKAVAKVEDSVCVEPTIQQTVEQTIETAFETFVEPAVEQIVETTVEETIEPKAEQTVGTTVEHTIESAVKPTVKRNIKPAIENTVGPIVERTVEPIIEQSVKRTVEEAVVETVEETAEETVVETVKEGYLAKTRALEKRSDINSSPFRISESAVSDNSAQSSFVHVEKTTSQLVSETLEASSNGKTGLVEENEAVMANDCDMKEEVVENNFIIETEVVNGLNTDHRDGSSATKVTKDLNFTHQEAEKVPNEVSSSPSENIVHEV